MTAQIFSDWLQEQSEPTLVLRGQIQRLQAELLRGIIKPENLRRIQLQLEANLRLHDETWQGPVRDHCREFSLQRGLMHITMDCASFLELQDQHSAWNQAMVFSLRLVDLEPRLVQHLADAPLLEEIPCLHLTRLNLDDAILEPLLQSRHLHRLVSLNLSTNLLSNATLNRIQTEGSFTALQLLDFRNNLITEIPQDQGESFHLDLRGNHFSYLGLPTLFQHLHPMQSQRLVNSIGMEMVAIPPGCFFMGSPESEVVVVDPDRDQRHEWDERPRHPVLLTRPFYLTVFPVTQHQFQEVMGFNCAEIGPNHNGHLHQPVDRVSWDQAVEFCRRLSEQPGEKQAGRLYRLPTEAEWEYACRAGTTSAYSWGHTACALQAQFDGRHPYGNAPVVSMHSRPARVGTFEPNPFGLYDMHGNVSEWCQDWYEDNTFREADRVDPQGPVAGDRKVCRGGNYEAWGIHCRSACRDFWYGTRDGVRLVGFRVAMTLAVPGP